MSIPFVKEFEFDYGVCAQLSPLIRRVVADNPGPFTYTGTGVYIIGTDEVCVIDPGPNTPKHAAALDTILADCRVTHVLVTHHHLDHSPLAAPLARKHGCQVLGYGAKPQTTPGDGIQLESGDDHNFKPDIEIRDGVEIFGKDWTLEALHTPGHTSNHMCFALQEENTLFSGDHIMGWSTSVVSPPDGDMGDYLESLAKIYDRHFDIIWPTHGPAIQDVDTFVQAYINHRLERERQILSVVQTGEARVMDIVTRLYTHIDKRLYPAAAHSVLAHLIHLKNTERIACNGAPTLQSLYRAA